MSHTGYSLVRNLDSYETQSLFKAMLLGFIFSDNKLLSITHASRHKDTNPIGENKNDIIFKFQCWRQLNHSMNLYGLSVMYRISDLLCA